MEQILLLYAEVLPEHKPFVKKRCQSLKWFLYSSRTSQCDHLSEATTLPKYQNFLSEIAVVGTSRRLPPLVSGAPLFGLKI